MTLLDGNRAIDELRVVAHIGVPLLESRSGQALGSLCAIDGTPRRWSDEELQDLSDLVEMVVDEFALRMTTRELAERTSEVEELARARRRGYEVSLLALPSTASSGRR